MDADKVRRMALGLANILGFILVCLIALNIQRIDSLSWTGDRASKALPLTMKELCEKEAQWFETLAETCRNRNAAGQAYPAAASEADAARGIPWVGDAPEGASWHYHAEYFERCATRAHDTARRNPSLGF
jgi:hypothetical protein